MASGITEYYGRVSKGMIVKYELIECAGDWGQSSYDPYICKETVYVYEPYQNGWGETIKWKDKHHRSTDMNYAKACSFELFMQDHGFGNKWPEYGSSCVLNANAYKNMMRGVSK